MDYTQQWLIRYIKLESLTLSNLATREKWHVELVKSDYIRVALIYILLC